MCPGLCEVPVAAPPCPRSTESVQWGVLGREHWWHASILNTETRDRSEGSSLGVRQGKGYSLKIVHFFSSLITASWNRKDWAFQEGMRENRVWPRVLVIQETPNLLLQARGMSWGMEVKTGPTSLPSTSLWKKVHIDSQKNPAMSSAEERHEALEGRLWVTFSGKILAHVTPQHAVVSCPSSPLDSFKSLY